MHFVPIVPFTIPAAVHDAATGIAMLGMLIFGIYALCHMGKRRPPYRTPRPWPWMFYPAYIITVLAWIDVLVVQGRIPATPNVSSTEMVIGVVLVLLISLLTQVGKQEEYNEKRRAADLEPEPC